MPNADACILNLNQALKDSGLSEDLADEIVAAYDAERFVMNAMEPDARSERIQQMLAEVKRRTAQKRVAEEKQLEIVLARTQQALDYANMGYSIMDVVNDIFDGNANAHIEGSLHGRTTAKHSLEDRYRRMFEEGLLIKNADGTVDDMYKQMWRQFLTNPNPETELAIVRELEAGQNQWLKEVGHRGYDADAPLPGYTGNKLAEVVAKSFNDLLRKHHDMLVASGADPGLIAKYRMEQKWFAELMMPTSLELIKAHTTGIEVNGEVLRGAKAVQYIRQQHKDLWVNRMLERSDEEAMISNIQKLQYADNASKYRKLQTVSRRIGENSPELAQYFEKAQSKLPEYKASGPKEISGMQALFGEHWSTLMKETRSTKRALARIASGELEQFDADATSAAKLLLKDTESQRALQNAIVPLERKVDLREFYNGVYDSIVYPTRTSNMYNALGRTTANKLALSRVIVLKDAEGWLQMQQAYGFNNLGHHIMSSISNMATDHADLKIFAGNPTGTMTKVFQGVEKELKTRLAEAQANGDAKAAEHIIKTLNKMPEAVKRAEVYTAYIQGKFNLRSNNVFNRIVTGLMNVGRLKLGQSLFPAFADTTYKIDLLNRLMPDRDDIMNNWNMAKHISTTIQCLEFEPIRKLFGDKQAKVHAFSSALKSQATRLSPFGMSEISNAGGDIVYKLRQMGRNIMDAYQKWTLTQQWDEGSKEAIANTLGTYLANYHLNGGKWGSEKFAAMREGLKMAGINETEWGIIAERGIYKFGKDKDDWAISAWQLEKNIKDSDLAKLAGVADASELTAIEKNTLRESIVSKYDEFIVGMCNTGVITPNLEVKAFLQGSADVDNPIRAMQGLVTEFLSYPARMSFDLWRGFVMDWTRNGPAGIQASAGRAARLMAMGYVLGYSVLAMKARANGKPAPDPINPNTFVQSMTVGGALGLYGEMAMEMYNQESLRDISAVLGPTGTMMLQAGELGIGMLKGEADSKKVVDFVLRNSPNYLAFQWVTDKLLAGKLYELIGQPYDPDTKIHKWIEKYGTLKDRLESFK